MKDKELKLKEIEASRTLDGSGQWCHSVCYRGSGVIVFCNLTAEVEQATGI